MALDFKDIREVWDVVRKGLEQVRKDSQVDWRLEDVYASCVNGKSHILMDAARSARGFVIVETVSIPFSNDTKLLLWIAYDPEPNSALAHAEELEHLARSTGHRQIELATPHAKLSKLAQQFGYTERWTVLTKELEQERCHLAAVDTSQKNGKVRSL